MLGSPRWQLLRHLPRAVEPIAIGYRNKSDLGKLYVRFNHQDASNAVAYVRKCIKRRHPYQNGRIIIRTGHHTD